MKTYLHYIFVFILFTFTVSLTSDEEIPQENSKFVVVLDAGHGGKDPGRPTKMGYKEKHIALKIALKVGAELEKNPNIKVIYTRKTDVFLELHERAAIANKADADLFVSIHCNAHNSQAYGTETFVLGVTNDKRNLEIAKKENEVIFLEDNHEQHYEGFDPNSAESIQGLSIIQEVYVDQSVKLARKIEDNFSKKLGRKSRGIKQASLWVMHNTYMPSVLVETGFITNKKEGAYLNSKNGQQRIATAIKSAIIDYKRELDGNVGTDVFIDSEEVEIETESTSTSPLRFNGVTFKIQIAAGKRKLAAKSYNFNGLSEISREKVNRIFRYYHGNTNDYNEAQALLENAKLKGYSDAYVVAFKDGERVSIKDLLNSVSN